MYVMNAITPISFYPVLKPVSYIHFLGDNREKSTVKTDTFVPEYQLDTQYQSAQKYVNHKDFWNRILLRDRAIQDYDLAKLEGLQKGIKVFDGLSMKQIAYMFEDFQSILVTRGCFNNCKHCYANAIPKRESMSFEDFELFISGVRDLQKRTESNIFKNNYKPGYVTTFYDSDGMLLEMKDKKGRIHDYTEIAPMTFDAVGMEHIFDTAGWSVNDKRMQARAERYVDYFKTHQYQFSQINISVNPFHSLYTKSLELNEKGEIEKADKLRSIYVDRMANAILTFIPIAHYPNFNIISRAFNDKYTKMSGYNLRDLRKLEDEIFISLCSKLEADLKGNKKYVSNREDYTNKVAIVKSKLFDEADITVRDGMLLSGRAKDLFLSHYSGELGFEYEAVLFADECFSQLKQVKHIGEFQYKLKKMIAPDGRVYVTDSYRLIPTDIQLNFADKNKKTYPLPQMEKEFIITEDML